MSDRRLDTAKERISELDINQKKLSRIQPRYTGGQDIQKGEYSIRLIGTPDWRESEVQTIFKERFSRTG